LKNRIFCSIIHSNFREKAYLLHLTEIDTDPAPDWQDLDADADPDPDPEK
jgi:hypothetical protein